MTVAGVTKPNLLLAIDIGNTNVSFGAFEGVELRASWRISTNRHRMADEYRLLVGELLRSDGWTLGSVGAVVIASVVPPVLSELSDAFAREDIDVVVLTAAPDFGLAVRYEPPESVGADRLANVIAVQERFGQPAIIVDLGTATTLDVLDSKGAYVGGAIAPGIETSIEGLFNNAFALPRLQLRAPNKAIGQTTMESIRSGTVLGWAALVDGLVDRFVAEMDGRPVVVATGGLAPLIAPHCSRVQHTDIDLTLQGLRLAYERVGGGVMSQNGTGA